MRHFFLSVLAALLLSGICFAQSSTHSVKRGETLSSIARLYHISTESLLEANPKAKDGIYYGMPLNIPTNNARTEDETKPRRSLLFVTHTIEEGETFNSIAKANNVDLHVLLDANPFCIFKPGYRILIPQSGSYTYLTGFASPYRQEAAKSTLRDADKIQAEALRMIETAPQETALAHLDSLCRTYGTQPLPQVTYQLGHYYAFGIFDTSGDGFTNPKTVSRYGRQAIDSDKAIYYLNEAFLGDASLMNTLMDEDGWLFNPQSVLYNIARLLVWNVRGFNKAMMTGIVECYPEYPFNVKDMYMDSFEEEFSGRKTAEEYEGALSALSLFPIDSLFTILPLLPKEYPAYSVNEMRLSNAELRGKADAAKKAGRLSEAMYYYRRLAFAGDVDSDYESWKYLDEVLTSSVGRHDAAVILSNHLNDYGSSSQRRSAYASVVDNYLDEYEANQKRIAEQRLREEERRAEEAREQRRREEERRQNLASGWQNFVNSFGYSMYNTYYPPMPSYSAPVSTPVPYVQPAWVTQMQISLMGDQVRQMQMDAAIQQATKQAEFNMELIKAGIPVNTYVPPSTDSGGSVTEDFMERNRIRNEEREAKLEEMKERTSYYSYNDCNHCHGSGICQTCNGRGIMSVGFTGTDTECPNCYIEFGRRTGKCAFCKGTGKRYSYNF